MTESPSPMRRVGRPKLSDKAMRGRRQRALNLLRRGFSKREVARLIGCSLSSVYLWLAESTNAGKTAAPVYRPGRGSGKPPRPPKSDAGSNRAPAPQPRESAISRAKRELAPLNQDSVKHRLKRRFDHKPATLYPNEGQQSGEGELPTVWTLALKRRELERVTGTAYEADVADAMLQLLGLGT